LYRPYQEEQLMVRRRKGTVRRLLRELAPERRRFE
jgi:hypothetical protein